MTQTTDLKLAGTALNADALPIALDDPMQITGALIAWEPGHPNAAFGLSGLPATGAANTGAGTVTRTTLGNIAAAKAAALLATTEANVKPKYRDNSIASQTTATPVINIKYERSVKGGLHVSPAQSGQTAFLVSGVELSDSVKAYMYANPAHVYYWSAWYRVTRADLTNTGPYVGLMKNSGAGSGWFSIGRAGPQGITGVVGKAVPVGARNTVGLVHERVANNYDATALSNATTDFLASLFDFGDVSGAYGPHSRNKAMSAILYRVNLIDLTAANLTFAEMAAIDDAAREEAFRVGGRYDDDTWTLPSVLWP